MPNQTERIIYRDTIRVGAWCPQHDASHLLITQLFIITQDGVWRAPPKKECA